MKISMQDYLGIPFGYLKGSIAAVLGVPISIIHAGRDATVKKVSELYGLTNKRSVMSPYEKSQGSLVSVEEKLQELSKYRYWIITMLFPGLDRVAEISYRTKAEYEATLTVLAILLWEKDRGEYPDSLDELVEGGYLVSLPDDIYAEGALTYRRGVSVGNELPTLRGGGFTLYSFGGDFDDDGGVESEDDKWGQKELGGDRVFWPVD